MKEDTFFFIRQIYNRSNTHIQDKNTINLKSHLCVYRLCVETQRQWFLVSGAVAVLTSIGDIHKRKYITGNELQFKNPIENIDKEIAEIAPNLSVRFDL